MTHIVNPPQTPAEAETHSLVLTMKPLHDDEVRLALLIFMLAPVVVSKQCAATALSCSGPHGR